MTVAAIAAVALTLSSCTAGGGGGSSDADTLVVSTFPFGVEQMQEALFDPFTEQTGIEVEVATGSNADRISQLQLTDGDDPGVDVMMMSDYYTAYGQDQGLFQPVDPDLLPELDNIADFAKEESYDGPAYSYQLNGTMYRTEALSEDEAADWSLYDDPDFSGRLALPDIAVTAGQLTVSGVADEFGSGPYDVDTAFSVLGDWAPNILQFYGSTTEVTNLITQGEIDAAASISGFATDLISSGQPVAWTPPEQGAYMATNRAVIPEGAAHIDEAHEFINFLLSEEAQTASADLVGDLPVNPSAEIPDDIRNTVGDVADDPVAAGYSTLDPGELVPTRDEWVSRFAREVSAS